MTNNPISPEQALEIFKQAGGIVIDGCAVGVSATDLANTINLAITKYFGEPVLYTTPDSEFICKVRGMTICYNKPTDLHTVPLYARKE